MENAFFLIGNKMRIFFTCLFALFLLVSCEKTTVKKPDNLIKEDIMVDIIYDLSLLEAIKSQKPAVLDSNSVNSKTYIYEKYKIDSLQFAKSDQYYASDIPNYKKMYDKVTKRIEDNKKITDSLVLKSGGKAAVDNPDTPQVK